LGTEARPVHDARLIRSRHGEAGGMHRHPPSEYNISGCTSQVATSNLTARFWRKDSGIRAYCKRAARYYVSRTGRIVTVCARSACVAYGARASVRKKSGARLSPVRWERRDPRPGVPARRARPRFARRGPRVFGRLAERTGHNTGPAGRLWTERRGAGDARSSAAATPCGGRQAAAVLPDDRRSELAVDRRRKESRRKVSCFRVLPGL
jgi:hypothetical protein